MTDFYRRKLPHWIPEGAVFFVTFRLADSLPENIRGEEEYERIIWYVMNNPVKAGLVKNWEDWKFTFVA